jgi:uncharacterized protein (DUF58 family)
MPKKPTSLPVVLDRHRVYIFPTGQGLVFVLVLIAMLAGSINYSNNLGFLLVFLLGGIFLVSMIHTYRNLLGIRVVSVSADPVFAGENAVFDVYLRPGGHPRKAIAVSVRKNRGTITDLSPHGDEKITIVIPTRQRGRFVPESIVVATVYPLGLFRAWTVLRPGVGCIVYPVPIIGPIVSAGEGKERGDDFKGLKSYEPGDSFRHIAWKTLSRGHGVLTKDFRGSRESDLIFDYHDLGPDNVETRLSRLCGMVLQAGREARKYGMVLPGRTISPGSGSAHRHRCLKSLALYGKYGIME